MIPLLPTTSPYPGPLTGPSHAIFPVEGARRLVVFFGAKDLSYEQFNFYQLGRELPESRMFLNNGANEWYQFGVPGLGDDFETSVAALKLWQAALNAEEICMVGTSMGAYAAIQYGAALGARVLCFAVDAVLEGPHTQSAKYFTGDKPASCPDLRTVLTQNKTDVTLFVGERDAVDLYSAWQLHQVAPINVISLVGVDHIVPSYLGRRARLGPLLRSFVLGETMPKQPNVGQAVVTKGYCETTFAALSAFEEGDWKKSEGFAHTALEAYPFGEAASLILAKALLRQNRDAEAVGWLASVVASQPEDIPTKTLLASALRNSGAMARARQIHAEILAEKPGAHRSHYALGLIEQKVGNLSAAEAAIREALRIAPKISAYKKRLVSIQQQSGEVKVKSQPIAPKLTAAKPKVKSDEMAQGPASKRTTAPKPPTKRTPNKQETAKRQVGL